jgi:exopolyphosphatase/guanosine-5'-triphosphate,3'-diphosphate pyrophosphatase
MAGAVHFRRSFDVGSVRLTERFVKADPVSMDDQGQMAEFLAETFAQAPAPPERSTVVGVAGTVTTLYCIQHEIDPYDATRVEGGELALAELRQVRRRLCALDLDARRRLKGLQPKRADVIPAGAMILEKAIERLEASRCGVSDRGLRWGLLAERFGALT